MIKHINIDPNGVCNAKCWFCPVAYLGNSKENRANMPIEMMENILKQIDEGRGDFVDPNIEIKNNPIHYNEMLLYPHLKEMLDLHRKYNIRMYVYTNGLNLTPSKSDLIKQYPDVVTRILLNVPSIERYQWAKFTGFNEKLFDKIINNLKYANDELSKIFKGDKLMLMVNGVDESTKTENGGWLKVLDKAPEYEKKEHQTIFQEIKNTFPNFDLVFRPNLSDRNGSLSELGVISNQEAIQEKHTGKVVGCGWNFPDEYLFISATGNVYLCADDFAYESIYTNIKNKTIKEIWQSKQRKEMIEKSYSSMCVKCSKAVWSDNVMPSLGSTNNALAGEVLSKTKKHIKLKEV